MVRGVRAAAGRSASSIAFVLALTAGLAVLSLLGRGAARAAARSGPRPTRLDGARRRLSAAGSSRSPSSAPGRRRCRRLGRRALAVSIAAPGRVLAVAAVLAVVGWGVGTQIAGDLRHPRARPGQPARASERGRARERHGGLRRGRRHRHRADDLTDPTVIAWMQRLRAARARPRTASAARRRPASRRGTEICPEISLPDLFFGDSQRRADAGSGSRPILRLLPPYFSQARRRRPTRRPASRATPA